jgi:hypothetical protein
LSEDEHSYGFWSRVVHRMALASDSVAEASFDIERALHGRSGGDANQQRPVFVTGLARAGTTIVMRLLYRTGAFRSLTYRDMPFVLAPNLWDRISRASRKTMIAEERAHGDGVLVDFDSPEALEEVFWRVKCGSAYIRDDRLVPMSAAPEIEQAFRDYVSLVLTRHPGRRYLSKNNNNVLRLGTLFSCFPDAAVLIPFREPLQHAISLMRQHRNFLERHDRDRFSRDYMTWLAHHEFGRDHRPFVFDGAAPGRGRELDLDYWLRTWTDTYGFIAAAAPEQCILLSYDRLCARSGPVWDALCARLHLPPQPVPEQLRRSYRADAPEPASADLLARAQALHGRLCERAL